MPRMWVRRKSDGRIYCCLSRFSTCYRAALYHPTVDSGYDQRIGIVTREVNEILGELQHRDANPDRHLAFLVVPDQSGEDVLRLEWVYGDDEYTTDLEGNY
jgi:hypothetical protein